MEEKKEKKLSDWYGKPSTDQSHETVDAICHAIKINVNNIKFVDQSKVTKEIALHTVRFGLCDLSYIPVRLRTSEFYVEAVNIRPGTLQYVPDEVKTIEMCMYAISQDGNVFGSIPTKYHTADLCALAVSKNPFLLQNIPNQHKTEQICIDSVSKLARMLQYVPENLRTYKVCKAAALSVDKEHLAALYKLIPNPVLYDLATEGLIKVEPNMFALKAMDGKTFNKLFSEIKFVKLTTFNETHNNFTFKTGLNTDSVKFNPNGQCSPGGLYFTELSKVSQWRTYNHMTMYWMRSVTVPDDAQVYIEADNKVKADKISLGERTQLPC
jgi:hypothetical protein